MHMRATKGRPSVNSRWSLLRGKRCRTLPTRSVRRPRHADREGMAGGPIARSAAGIVPALVAGEALLLVWYGSRGEHSHWLTHLLAGTVVALLALTYWVQARGRAPRPPAVVVVVVAAQLLGTTPDVLVEAGVRQGRWMDVFLGSVSAHYTPAGNLTWAALTVAAAFTYATVVRAVRPPPASRGRRARNP